MAAIDGLAPKAIRTVSVVGEAEPPASFSALGLQILTEGLEATIATLRPDGWPQATVINYVTKKGVLYFDCASDSQKAQNISNDDRVSMTILVPYPAFGPIYAVSLAGHARRLITPADITRVVELWKKRYPYMQARMDGDLSAFSFYSVDPIVLTTADYAAGLGHRGGA